MCLSSILTLFKNINHFYSLACIFSIESDETCNLYLSDLIGKLISEKKQPDAVRFIYAFELVDKFPPVPLLEAHLNQFQKVAKVGSKKGKNSSKSQVHVPFIFLEYINAPNLRKLPYIAANTSFSLDTQFVPSFVTNNIVRLDG